MVRPAVPRGVLSRPQPLTASAPDGTSAARQARRGGPRPGPQVLDPEPAHPPDHADVSGRGDRLPGRVQLLQGRRAVIGAAAVLALLGAATALGWCWQTRQDIAEILRELPR